MTEQELIDKIEWEGGILAALDYGLGPEDLDEDADPQFRSLWLDLCAAWTKLDPVMRRFEHHIAESDYEDN